MFHSVCYARGGWSAGGIQQWRKRTSRCQYAHTSQPISPHTAKDPTEKGNGSSALYLIIYSLFRRISASIAKTIVLTILRFLDFAFAR
ncbi:MAG: hypothetical protein HXN41_11120 [Prevotella histicola]|uniref:hypothetical protein n=1 Tax=Prevotella histicola TaxID=470565 RepID=UPI001CAE6671|nr:hypothetical protein [Prevotella histicola]MBF1426248.1 hypothetical protein [Prevotella histicola]MBS5898205.1 hypothetical protein [Prevotella histicola]